MESVPGKEDAVRLVLAELGDAPAAGVAAFAERRYGVRIEPKFVPIFKASLRARQMLEEARARARAALAEPAATSSPPPA
jgi:hypothetical protein